MSSSNLNSMLKRFLFYFDPKAVIKNSVFFDPHWYEKMYKIPAHKAAYHYLKEGYLLHYNPSRQFDGDLYLIDNPDVKSMNPLLHYETFGYKENRKMSLCNKYLRGRNNRSPLDNTRKTDIGVFELCDKVSSLGGKVYGREYIKTDRLVFVFSHELSRTGAPLVLEKLVSVLKKLGYSPLMISFSDGSLVSSYLQNNVPVIVCDEILDSGLITRSLNCAEFCVVNSLNTYICKLIKILSDARKNTLWWVHESKLSYNDYNVGMLPKRLSKSIRIVTAGWYAKEALLKALPEYEADVLVYGVSEVSDDFVKKAHNNTVFSVIGSIEPRKGHNVVLQAIESLPADILKKCQFLFAGKNSDKNIGAKLAKLENKYPDNIHYYGILDAKGIADMYSETDCLICCSYDDPLPVVVTDAWQYEIPTICSENIGQSKLIEEYGCGILYKNNDYLELRDAIVSFCNGNHDLTEITRQAKSAFLDHFSMSVFEKNVKNAVNSFAGKAATVFSAVAFINVSDAGDDYRSLAEDLKKQRNTDLKIVLLNGTNEDVSVSGCQVLNLNKDSFESAVASYLKENECDYVLFASDCYMKNDLSLYNVLDEMDVYRAGVMCIGERYGNDYFQWKQFILAGDNTADPSFDDDWMYDYCFFTSHAYIIKRELILDAYESGDGDECAFKTRLLTGKPYIMLAEKASVELTEPIAQGHILKSIIEYNERLNSDALTDTDLYFKNGLMQRTVLTYYLYAVIFADLTTKQKCSAADEDTLFDLIVDIMTKTEISLRTGCENDFYDLICRKPSYFDNEMYDLALQFMYRRLYEFKPNKVAVDDIGKTLINKLCEYLCTYEVPETEDLLDLISCKFIPYWVTYKISLLLSGVENSYELTSGLSDY